MNTTFTTPTLLAATAGLIAFHIGVLTLVGRERRAPYVIDKIFPIFILSLLVAATGSAAAIVRDPYRNSLLWLGGLLFVAAVLLSVAQVFRMMARLAYFEDSFNPKYWATTRWIEQRRTAGQLRPTYPTNPTKIGSDLRKEILAILERSDSHSAAGGADQDMRSLAVATDRISRTNPLLVGLAIAFLKQGCSVQYMAASRHPIELVDELITSCQKANLDFPPLAKHIVVVDAYSPHFAFKDKIYWNKANELTAKNITFHPSRMTYAGIHTSSSHAFKTIRAQTGQKDVREPTLVIYEGAYALADLESSEQYRTFIRHVLPSERYWDGMFTVVVECALPESDWLLLCGYTSQSMDFRDEPAVSGSRGGSG